VLQLFNLRGVVKTFPEFFDIDGSVRHEIVPSGKSFIGHFLGAKFCRGSGATSVNQGQWLLQSDNAPSHASLVVQQFLSSPKHRIVWISVRVTFGCSIF
jgi:hypothetical protein